MSLSTQLLQFIGVALVFIIFTFAWGWYIGRREERESRSKSETSGPGGER